MQKNSVVKNHRKDEDIKLLQVMNHEVISQISLSRRFFKNFK